MVTSNSRPEPEQRQLQIPLRAVNFGDLKRFSPIGGDFGYERGTPIDRYYIESFLARNAADVRGRVLELASNDYTIRFGGTRVAHSDVLTVESTNPNATIAGDLCQESTLAEAAFDCIIFTQALQYFYDVRRALEMLHRALKPSGVLLATVPAIAPLGDWPNEPFKPDRWPWYCVLTLAGLRRLMEDRFGRAAVSAEAHGNIFAATAFLYGLAFEELETSDLEVDDPRYPVTVAARAIKRDDT